MTARILLSFLLLLPPVLHADDLKDFVHKSHHEMETSFFKSLNPRELLLNAIRYHNMNSEDPAFGKHAKNLALMIPVTEGLELATGPTVTAITLNNEFGGTTEAIMNAVGWLISTPSIEVYCGAMTIAYFASPKFQNGVTRFREALSANVKSACHKMGLTQLFDSWFPHADLIESLSENGWVFISSAPNAKHGMMYLQLGDDSFIALHLGTHNGLYVDSIEVQNVPKKELKKQLKILNWSARSLLVRDAQVDSYTKNYIEREVLLKPKRKLCDHLFKSS